MSTSKTLHVFIGYDGREAICTDVAAYSIRHRTSADIKFHFLKHRDLRKAGYFARPWLVDGATGEFLDLIDSRKFSTEFSHTRFLVPELMGFKGWALFMDADMIFLSDIENLFSFCDDKFAAMCVKHNHIPTEKIKMDGREQLKYFRKNWSSFVLWNCSHPANRGLTKERVNFMKGSDLHSFSWLTDNLIGALPFSYNYISGVSPKMPPESGGRPDVIHFTDGGPWFSECQDVPYAGMWVDEYEEMQSVSGMVAPVPTIAFEPEEIVKK